MFKTRLMWIRAIEGVDENGAAGGPTDAQQAGEAAEYTTVAEQSGQDDTPPAETEENPDGRGSKSKSVVLADLARERDKRQALEARLAEFEQAKEQRKRSEMTEIERLQADLEVARKVEEDARAEITKRDLDAERARIAAEFKIPAAMAGRIAGATPEEMREDAKALGVDEGSFLYHLQPKTHPETGWVERPYRFLGCFRASLIKPNNKFDDSTSIDIARKLFRQTSRLIESRFRNGKSSSKCVVQDSDHCTNVLVFLAARCRVCTQIIR
ncbi:DUF4355 domain-containing protein [Corynebacterium lactis]|uniref:Uncharacterized protein n=1 Tax=Corynebacterium lactis RW2-5 TaxID=1408189 RepID=A0A0K2H1E0_9CORY|nr:DUF4355 domain-containing protein [Corynebacterium lactis]ALA67551.1 hypothetical protein CLAC_07185 [Corynebacterium lactis RW2-5]